MEGGVTEKDNVLLSLCCSKNSTTNRTRKEGFIYRNISQVDFHLGFMRLFCFHCRLDLRLEGGMRLGWGWGGGGRRSFFLINGQQVENRQETGRGLWATSLVRPCFLWTSRLTAEGTHKTKMSSASFIHWWHVHVEPVWMVWNIRTGLTYQERCLVFWGPVLQRRHPCQILQSRKWLKYIL